MSEFLTPANLAAAALFISLLLYVLTGGADFGGGLWSFGARLRGERQTAEVAEQAIGPIWEADHVWLILAVVILFVCFAPAYALLTTVLHIPLTLALLGIVFRGSAYVFGAYGLGRQREADLWRGIFGAASLVTPFVLGQCVGALATGQVTPPQPSQSFWSNYVAPWLGLFPLLCGAFAVSMFAHLAAVYLTLDADTEGAREMYRLYGIASGIGLGVGAFVTTVAIPHTPFGDQLFERLFKRWWSIPLHLATAAAAIGALGALLQRAYIWARRFVVAQVSLILTGWAIAQYPYLVPNSITIAAAASEDAVIIAVLVALLVGTVIVLPALAYLFRVFKSTSSVS